MQRVYAADAVNKRKLKFLYHQSGIAYRYSVLPDFSLPADQWTFFPGGENLEPFPSLDERMHVYKREASSLCTKAIDTCIADAPVDLSSITHLITVSCTGMCAPGI